MTSESEFAATTGWGTLDISHSKSIDSEAGHTKSKNVNHTDEKKTVLIDQLTINEKVVVVLCIFTGAFSLFMLLGTLATAVGQFGDWPAWFLGSLAIRIPHCAFGIAVGVCGASLLWRWPHAKRVGNIVSRVFLVFVSLFLAISILGTLASLMISAVNGALLTHPSLLISGLFRIFLNIVWAGVISAGPTAMTRLYAKENSQAASFRL